MGQAQSGAFEVEETGQSFARLQQAVNAIGDGRGTIRIANGVYSECAVQAAGAVTYLAVEAGQAIFDGVTCEGKAALVLRGRSAQVSGLVFQNMAVPDYNGAGIRLERGNLTVAQSWFRDSQQGILTAADPNGQIVIDHSTFSRLGTCAGAGGCAHSAYIGDYGVLRVTRSRFEQGRGGHYLKSRARKNDVASSSFDDTQGRATNYMIDLPGGSVGQISNNRFVQGRDKENYSALIAIAAEGQPHTSEGLQIIGNDARVAPDVQHDTTFVANWSDDNVRLSDNKLGPRIQKYERR
ncbi:right-handed parallel beta-helix repeat-containing protein [Altererythrobacter endophyticus]|uniref:Right-handed parallel beta-helix repeat-containing protein n=2 Tax=Altericroceibacterium endophyticum TaxID=1808508 RepID=A0A6I4T7J7_9SPHN|nr:right-handed parallel beta-helix repeat-containing protein [Altericroceibacterium endophyticum]